MSISSALANALSGLTANAARAQVASANIANALTPGYAPRALEVSARGTGDAGGVTIRGIVRDTDPGLLAARRAADGDLASAEVRAGFAADLEVLAGTPDLPDSLSARLAALEASLVSAAARPEEDSRLRDAVRKAAGLAAKFNEMGRTVQEWRSEAEEGIEHAVAGTNAALREVHALNLRILDAARSGHPTAAFEDERRIVLDRLAELVPIRLGRRDNGSVAIYSTGGSALLDGRPAELAFTAGNAVAAHMTIENGLLGGLSINGRTVAPPSGGRIGGLFDLRDRLAVDAQAQIDALARDLVERVQDPALDPTRAADDRGLFTDGGEVFDPANETGLAQRLALDRRVDPAAGGAPWRLRDGLGATAPGDAGQGALLNQLSSVLGRPAGIASGDLGTREHGLSGHVASLISRIGQDRLALEQQAVSAAARQAGLEEAEQGAGVDSDAEMRHLMLIEQAYAANARVIEIMGNLMDALLRI